MANFLAGGGIFFSYKVEKKKKISDRSVISAFENVILGRKECKISSVG
jgi:hypothetical protein